MKPGAMHRFPSIHLTTEENPGKPQLKKRLLAGLLPVIASNGVPYLQITSVGSHCMSRTEKEEIKEGRGSGRFANGTLSSVPYFNGHSASGTANRLLASSPFVKRTYIIKLPGKDISLRFNSGSFQLRKRRLAEICLNEETKSRKKSS